MRAAIIAGMIVFGMASPVWAKSRAEEAAEIANLSCGKTTAEAIAASESVLGSVYTEADRAALRCVVAALKDMAAEIAALKAAQKPVQAPNPRPEH